MPDIFWNAGRNDRVTGLDVLGLRGFDQDLERQWVAGITTISFRARYLALLPWVCAEFFRRQLDDDVEAAFSHQQFEAVLRRLEAVVVFSTHIGLTNGETGRPTGVIGTDLFREEGQRLDQDQTLEIPTSKGGSVLGTYFMPCKSFGLIDWPLTGSPLPVSVPPRGKQLWQARANAMSGVKLAELVLEGGVVSRADVIEEGRFFSVNNIQSIPEELALLRSTFLMTAPDVNQSVFQRLQQTIDWGLGEAKAAPLTAADMIRQTFARLVRTPLGGWSAVERAWGEYELYRRVHFACEILLFALVRTMDGRSMPISDVIEEWFTHSEMPPAISQPFGWQAWPTGQLKHAVVPSSAYLDDALPVQMLRKLAPPTAAAFGFALLLVCVKHGRLLREAEVLSLIDSPFGRLSDIVERYQEAPIPDFLLDFVTTAIASQHISNALRKMAAGGPCTLRFFWDGEVLCPTGTSVMPGFSGDRLSNVLGMLADLGYADRASSTAFHSNALGKTLLHERQVPV
ncbi:MAG TPA: hypothetical protein VNJ04_09545 [Gemmatimonadaceae bacterium]|nr:hypothetical protein [Gemmatimonadaceae bacterium]